VDSRAPAWRGASNWNLYVDQPDDHWLCRKVPNLLVVAGNVTLATSLVFEDTIIETECQSTRELTAFEITLASGACDIDGLDVEGSRRGRLATSRGALGHGRRSGKGEDSEGLHFQIINRSDDKITDVGLLNSDA
jgi:hypothetical protein